MGSYAYALSPKERWSVASYVKRLTMMDSLGNVPAIKAMTSEASAITVQDTTKN